MFKKGFQHNYEKPKTNQNYLTEDVEKAIIKLRRISATFLYIKEQENQRSDFLSSSFHTKVRRILKCLL